MRHIVRDKNLRIFLGPCWYGRIAPTLGAALREKGLKVTVAVRGDALAIYPDAKYDVIMNFQGLNTWQYMLKRARWLLYFARFLCQYDAFVFLFGDTFLPYNLDLFILKLLGKKTIMWFIGSDILDYGAYEKAAQKAGLKYFYGMNIPEEIKGESNLEAKKRMIRRAEKYTDYIISYPSISHLLTRKYYTIFVPVDVHNIKYNNVPNPRPVVVHAPTSDIKKGTDYVVKAVEQLKSEGYDFEFCLLRNTPNRVVRETLSRADIAVDQLYATLGGMFALESMAAGCAVLGGNIPRLSGFPQELPIIHTDPGNIYQNLKLLLGNPKLRHGLGEKGRKYVEKYHDARKIADDILQLLSGNTENLVSYEPTVQL